MYKTNLVLVIIVVMTSCSKDLLKNNPLGNNPIVLNESNSRNPTHCDFTPCLGEGDIAISNIPVVISDYISANYSSKITEAQVMGCNIAEVENENEQDGNFNNDHSDVFAGSVDDIDFFIVELKNNLELLFDHSGIFIAEEKGQEGNFENEDGAILENVSEEIKSYIAANYPGETIVKASTETTFGFEFIEIETENKNLTFNANNEFVCEKDE